MWVLKRSEPKLISDWCTSSGYPFKKGKQTIGLCTYIISYLYIYMLNQGSKSEILGSLAWLLAWTFPKPVHQYFHGPPTGHPIPGSLPLAKYWALITFLYDFHCYETFRRPCWLDLKMIPYISMVHFRRAFTAFTLF